MSTATAPTETPGTISTRRPPEQGASRLASQGALIVTLAFAGVVLIAAPFAAARSAPPVPVGSFLPAYLSALAMLALGGWVGYARRTHEIGAAFLTLGAAAAAVLASTPVFNASPLMARFWLAALPWAGGSLAYFALIFPAPAALLARRPALRIVPPLAALAVILYAQAAGPVAAGRAAAIAVAVLAAVLAGALFFWRGVSATSPAVREQARVVFAGLLAGVVLFIPGALGAAIPTGWLLVSTLLFPASVAYTVSQYSVLTTSRFARDAATVGVLAAAVSLGYALIVAGLNAVLSGVLEAPLSATNPVLVSLLAFGIALGLDPLRRRLRAALDTRLLRTQGNYQARLTDFRHQLTLAAGLGEVVRLIKQQIGKVKNKQA